VSFSLVKLWLLPQNGQVYGCWLQDCVGTLQEALDLAEGYNDPLVMVVDMIPSTTPLLGSWGNLKPYVQVKDRVALNRLPCGEYTVLETGEVVDLADLRFGYYNQVLTLRANV
jgi:hypothetical protein